MASSITRQYRQRAHMLTPELTCNLIWRYCAVGRPLLLSHLSSFANQSAHTPTIRASDTLPRCANATHTPLRQCAYLTGSSRSSTTPRMNRRLPSTNFAPPCSWCASHSNGHAAHTQGVCPMLRQPGRGGRSGEGGLRFRDWRATYRAILESRCAACVCVWGGGRPFGGLITPARNPTSLTTRAGNVTHRMGHGVRGTPDTPRPRSATRPNPWTHSTGRNKGGGNEKVGRLNYLLGPDGGGVGGGLLSRYLSAQ